MKQFPFRKRSGLLPLIGSACLASCAAPHCLVDESSLPASRGLTQSSTGEVITPLRFERWTYGYSDAVNHHLVYRWHTGRTVRAREVLVPRSDCALAGVKLVGENAPGPAIALQPLHAHEGHPAFITDFKARTVPNDVWTVTPGRFRQDPVNRDWIDELLE